MTLPHRVWSHLRLPLPLCLQSPQPNPISVFIAVSLGFSLSLVSFSPCLSVSLSPPQSLLSAFLFLLLILCLGLCPHNRANILPLTSPAGPFVARASPVDTSAQLGVGLIPGPRSSSLSPLLVPTLLFTYPIRQALLASVCSLLSFGLVGLRFFLPVRFHLSAFISGFQCHPQSGCSVWPRCRQRETTGVHSHHPSTGTQPWEGWAGEALGVLGLPAWKWGEGHSPLPAHSPPLPSHNFPFLHFLCLSLPLVYTPQIRTGCYHGS